jgi:hypothetical protein
MAFDAMERALPLPGAMVTAKVSRRAYADVYDPSNLNVVTVLQATEVRAAGLIAGYLAATRMATEIAVLASYAPIVLTTPPAPPPAT